MRGADPTGLVPGSVPGVPAEGDVRRPGSHNTDIPRRGLGRLVARPTLLLVVVAATFGGLGLHQAWADSPTYDEPIYLSAGVTALTQHDLRLNPEHPPLAKVIAALPVLLAHPIVPKGPAWVTANESGYASSFVHAQLQAGKLRSELLLLRLVPLSEAIAIGFVLFGMGRRLFGTGAGLVAALLWWADPLTLGLGHLDGVDLPLTLATLLTAWALLSMLRKPGRRQLVLLGAACGSVILTKDNGMIVASSAAIVVFAAGWKSLRWHSSLRALLVAAVAWAVMWACYAVIAPSSVTHLSFVPEPYLAGIRYLAHHDTIGGPAYLLGTSWVGGRWWYWPASLVVKVPLTTIALLVIGPIALRTARTSIRREIYAVAVLPGVLLIAFTLISPKDIGLRYLLPVIALWLLAASSVVLTFRRVIVRVMVVGAVIIAGIMAVVSTPHSIAWVNPEFAPAYRTTSNSDVDWGQDFWLLKDWSRQKRPWVAYFGQGLTVADITGARSMVHPNTKGTPTRSVDPHSLTGWLAISATLLNSDHSLGLGWLRAYCPVGDLGGSILIYRFASPPVVLPPPVVPAPLCDGKPQANGLATARFSSMYR
jgi:4-amino-4-deoxy-L-arabinose transferase-like glycosyltransferase